MSFRTARISDIHQILVVVLEYLETQCTPVKELVLEDIATHIVQDDKFFFVYCDDENQIRGVFYGGIDHNVFNGQRYAKERLMFVFPEFRSTNVFKGFLDNYDHWARAKGCDFSRFQATGSESNEALSRLMVGRFGYEQVGFVLQKKYE